MSKFSVNTQNLRTHGSFMDNASSSLLNCAKKIDAVKDDLEPVYFEIVPSLMFCSSAVSKDSAKATDIGDALRSVANIFEAREQIIINKLNAQNTPAGTPNPNYHNGETRTGLPDGEGFVRVTDENGNVYYGGDQNWFPEGGDPNTNDYGCGVIACVNYYLYLAGITDISKEEYMKLCEEFYQSGMFRKTAVTDWKGALPPQMEDFIYQKLNENGVHNVMPYWDYTGSYESDYDYMKQELANGRPIIWAVHDEEGEVLNFYNYNDSTGAYVPSGDGASSHYITVTGIYESTDANGNQVRWVEVSNCGKKQYVSWDEYLDFVDAQTLKDKAFNRVGSSVMKVQ